MPGTVTTEQGDGRSVRAHAQRRDRRARILKVALGVFAERGYHQTRVTDIIEAAGIARGTFYLYFESKNAIFVELLDELLAHLRSNIVGIDTNAGARPIEDQLLDTVVRIIETVRSNRRLATIIVREAVGLDEAVDQRLTRFYESLHRYMTKSLREGQRLGLIRPLDTEIVATCILGSVKHVMEQFATRGLDPLPRPERVSRAILEHNLMGVLSPPLRERLSRAIAERAPTE